MITASDEIGVPWPCSDLVKIQTNKACDERRSSSNSRNDLARNLLCGMAVCYVDIVVHGAEIGCCGDEVDMMIGIIILFELYNS